MGCCFGLPIPVSLKEDEEAIVSTCFTRYAKEGPGCICIPFCGSYKKCKGETLTETQYLKIKNTLTGDLRLVKGPCIFFFGPYDEVKKRLDVISLGRNEFVKIENKLTGERRVEEGECKVYLDVFEEEIETGVGYHIDEHHAVLVRNTDTAEMTLVELVDEPSTKKGVKSKSKYRKGMIFIPGPYQEVVKEQEKVLLEDYEVAILKDEKGNFKFMNGQEQSTRAFFVPPFHEIVELTWSNPFVISRVALDKKKPPTTRTVSRFDMRPNFMSYEFIARTVDNVELAIAVTFFWRIIDVDAMIHSTADAPGDICTHAKSVIIQAVAKVKLMDFLAGFNDIVMTNILESEDKFYVERGVELLTVEVRHFKCVSTETDSTLQEIIHETATRIKALEKQRSRNEVAEARVEGEIIEETAKARLAMVKIDAETEQEKANATLVDLKKEHEKRGAEIEGTAEAGKIMAFLNTIGDSAAEDVKLDLYKMLRKLQAIESVSSGKAQLYYTPNDVNLSIESLSLPSHPNKRTITH